MRKWKENEEMKRKWRENEEIERKWRENEEMERDYFTTTLKYVTFSRKNLCIRSTHYDYEPKRLTFLRCVPKLHFNGACQSWNDCLVPTSSS